MTRVAGDVIGNIYGEKKERRTQPFGALSIRKTMQLSPSPRINVSKELEPALAPRPLDECADGHRTIRRRTSGLERAVAMDHGDQLRICVRCREMINIMRGPTHDAI